MLRRMQLKFRHVPSRRCKIMSPTIAVPIVQPPSPHRLPAHSTPKIVGKILVERQSIRALDRFLLP